MPNAKIEPTCAKTPKSPQSNAKHLPKATLITTQPNAKIEAKSANCQNRANISQRPKSYQNLPNAKLDPKPPNGQHRSKTSQMPNFSQHQPMPTSSQNQPSANNEPKFAF